MTLPFVTIKSIVPPTEVVPTQEPSKLAAGAAVGGFCCGCDVGFGLEVAVAGIEVGVGGIGRIEREDKSILT